MSGVKLFAVIKLFKSEARCCFSEKLNRFGTRKDRANHENEFSMEEV